MGKLCQVAGISMILVLSTACSDDDPAADAAPGNPDASVVDGAVPDAEIPDAIQYDAIPCPARAMGDVGGPCTAHTDCDTSQGAGDGFCLRGLSGGVIRWPSEGYCVVFNGCTMDSDCGANNVCASFDGFATCMPECCLGVACPGGQICSDSLFADTLNTDTCIPGDNGATDGDSCDTFGDCHADSRCINNPLEAPSGQCQTIGCTVGDDSTCAANGDGHCITDGEINYCVDTCTQTTDCNDAEGWECSDNGADGLYCDHPLVGDPCAADSECGNSPPWSCLMGATFPGGYCTSTTCNSANNSGCNLGSAHCYDPDTDPNNPNGNEYCTDQCDPNDANSCRNGYDCVAFTVGNGAGGTVGVTGCVPE